MGETVYALFFNDHLINESPEKEELVRLRKLFVKRTQKRMMIVSTRRRRAKSVGKQLRQKGV
ncbi:MAG: hypothetical protein DRG59_07620 [Deltaproteobacteria bacterium]|nr:MAG: hypothetical protein DRG83_19015 [Deltaproteobacteria bacterium]RLB06622.1 MAG: hypothetical protein DRG59_07620 [Deltaproteobacteria bacterium]HEC31902.1 hypothetical protein [Deltaproteobacteria bacterium]